MRLSVIIPYYNTAEYTDELLECLDRQMQPGVEGILIDDGSKEPYKPKYKWLKVIRKKNEGQGKARNVGLERARGEWIQFIDSDDMVAPDFLARILEKTETDADLIEFSWKSLTASGVQFDYRVSEGRRLTNPSVCTRTFRRSYIGDTRFSEIKDAAEDEDFSRRLGYLYLPLKVATIPEYMYFYRTDHQGSNVKTYKQGFRKTKRIVYYFDKVTEDRTDILEAIKADDEKNEVFLLTNDCQLPDLRRWCQILRPVPIWAHFQKGEPNRFVTIIEPPIRSRVILFIKQMCVIGGIETFIFEFAKIMRDYDLTLLVQRIPEEQERKLRKVLKVIRYDKKKTYSCESLIMLRVLDSVPQNITYDQSIRMCHACRTDARWHIPQECDHIVNVSEASKASFGSEAENALVIHNPIEKNERKALVLVSATRIPAPDKGENEKRMRTLANMIHDAGIPFVWFNFSDGKLTDAPFGMVNMGQSEDITPYIARADYLVQLSDSEAWSYSILEALTQNVPVLVCPFPSAEEMGVRDGQNGYLIPFDMDFDVEKLLEIPHFEYDYDTKVIKEQWKKLLNKRVPSKKRPGVRIRILTTYRDMRLNRMVDRDEKMTVPLDRANELIEAGLAEKADE